MKLCMPRCAVLLTLLALASSNRIRPRPSTLPALIGGSLRSRAAANASHAETLESLGQRERMLRAAAKREEAALEKHQGSLSQARSKGKASAHVEAEVAYEQLERKEDFLQGVFKKEEQLFESRQASHKRATASAGSLLQQKNRAGASQVAIDRLLRKEKMLQRFSKQEEADFAERQRHYHPLARGSAMLQQGKAHAGQVRDTSDQLLRRLGRLQAVEKQVQEDLYSRQPVHRPQMAPPRSRGQETESELKRRLSRLSAESKEEHQAFLQSAKKGQ